MIQQFLDQNIKINKEEFEKKKGKITGDVRNKTYEREYYFNYLKKDHTMKCNELDFFVSKKIWINIFFPIDRPIFTWEICDEEFKIALEYDIWEDEPYCLCTKCMIDHDIQPEMLWR